MAEWNNDNPETTAVRPSETESSQEMSDALYDKSENVEAGAEKAELLGNPEKLREYHEYQGFNQDGSENPDSGYDCDVYAQRSSMEALGNDVSHEDLKVYGENIQVGRHPDGDPKYAYDRSNRNEDLRGTYDSGYGYDKFAGGREVVPPTENAQEAQENLKTALKEDKAVIVGVDAGTLDSETYAPGGHSVWVTGAEVDANGDIAKVYANDPGRPDGRMIDYDGKTFMRAWSDGNYEMVKSRETFKY